MVRPLRRVSGGFLYRPLDVVFGAPSHIAILRALNGAASGLTGRQVAKGAGIAQGAAAEGLRKLVRAKIVRQQPAGRAFLYTLNRDLPLVDSAVQPMLEFERSMRGRIVGLIRSTLAGRCVAAALYGSAARGEERPESDLDVCVIVKRPSDKESVRNILDKLIDTLAGEGVTLSPLVLTTRELREGIRLKTPSISTLFGRLSRFPVLH